ncbi:hypothetical protein H4R34_002387 [Dimargaris verticillata]|uniref:Uncharacterized protein n=1 Tax=Dimargaris verticillata TaxID=2761393 RepID=A0A9W8EE45_9FUNG|nr:hypothetical protein H4R34_002387 [Dimargaris verticillata]
MTVAQDTPAVQANNTVNVAALKENVAPPTATTEAPTTNGKATGGGHDDDTDASVTATKAPSTKRVKSNHDETTDAPTNDKTGEAPAVAEDDKVEVGGESLGAQVSETVELIQNDADYDEEEDDDFEVNAEDDEEEEFDDEEAADDDDDDEDFGAEEDDVDGVNEAELIEDEEGLGASEAEEEAAERDTDALDQHQGEQDDE